MDPERPRKVASPAEHIVRGLARVTETLMGASRDRRETLAEMQHTVPDAGGEVASYWRTVGARLSQAMQRIDDQTRGGK